MSERVPSLSAILAQIPDPRKARGLQYPWMALLLLVVVGLLCGANSQRALDLVKLNARANCGGKAGGPVVDGPVRR